ncbi:MAG: hypothetical protein EAX96_04935 [Candidatus Lokiarchaeota archaeon]|nr:hypothetical protein [Candidatus Lokiarchaeota archaeon]
MEELEKEKATYLAKREELIKQLNELKDLSDNGVLTATDYLKKYDEKSEQLNEIQDKIKQLRYKREEFIKKAEFEEKKFKDLSKKRDLFSNLIQISKKNYITVEEFTDFISQAFEIEIDEMSDKISNEKLDLFPLDELNNATTYLDQYIEQIITPEEIKSRAEKEKEEEQKRKEQEKAQKELERKQKEEEKTTPEKPEILDRKIYRKKEVLPALDQKAGFVDRWALMHAVSPITKRTYISFTEIELIVKDHPNFIHNEFHHYLEDLGYKIESETIPLPKEILIQDKINKVFNFAASIKGTIEVEKEKVKGFTSIYAVEEGFCTFAHGEKKPSIFCKMKISMAADADNMSLEDLKADINIVVEKLKSFKINNDKNGI